MSIGILVVVCDCLRHFSIFPGQKHTAELTKYFAVPSVPGKADSFGMGEEVVV